MKFGTIFEPWLLTHLAEPRYPSTFINESQVMAELRHHLFILRPKSPIHPKPISLTFFSFRPNESKS